MIHAHRVIDAIRRRIPGTSPPMSEFVEPERLDNFANLIEAAEKFDFGTLVLEKGHTSINGVAAGDWYTIPDFTPTEWELWGLNLVPLPAEVCWYEFSLGGTSRLAILVYREPELKRWCAVRFELAPKLWWDCVMIATEQRNKSNETWGKVEMHSLWMMTSVFSDEEKRNLYGDVVHTSIYLTLMLGSKTTIKRAVPAPKLTNKMRAKNNKPPLAAHSVVRIVPWKYINESQREAGRTHTSPRLHWRRSHLRVYDHRTPASTFVEGKGWCVAIPRSLVNAAAESEVSHEYFVEAFPASED